MHCIRYCHCISTRFVYGKYFVLLLCRCINRCTRYLCFNIFVVVCDTVPWGMQSSIFLCLFQARINWEGCGRKGIRRKNGGDDGGGSLTSSQGVAPSRTVGVSASVIFRCTIKPRRRWLAKVRLLGITLSVPPHAYTSTRWGNPARTQHNPVLRQMVVFVMTQGLINCRKARDFGSVPGTLTY